MYVHISIHPKYIQCTNIRTLRVCMDVRTKVGLLFVNTMLNKNTLGVKKVRGQSEATMVI